MLGKTSNEVIIFADLQIEVRRRAYRRTLSLIVQPNGVIELRTAIGARRAELMDFLQAHREWLLRSLQRVRERKRLHPLKTLRDGEELLFLGRPHTLRLQAAAVRSARVLLAPDTLLLQVPQRQWSEKFLLEECPQFWPAVWRFYEESAHRLLPDRVRYYAEKMQQYPESVKIRGYKTRWGSCSYGGHISFNWRLLFAPLEIVDYIVVHELAHLRHYNHSPRFWQLVQSQMPNCRAQRQWLREHQQAADFLCPAK